jgi:hypothetical protein
MKVCSKCKLKLDKSNFRKDNSKKDGLRPDCKSCGKEIGIVWRENNKDKINEKRKIYKEANKERLKQQRDLKKEDKQQYDKQYKIDNKERIRERDRLYQERKRLERKQSSTL